MKFLQKTRKPAFNAWVDMRIHVLSSVCVSGFMGRHFCQVKLQAESRRSVCFVGRTGRRPPSFCCLVVVVLASAPIRWTPIMNLAIPPAMPKTHFCNRQGRSNGLNAGAVGRALSGAAGKCFINVQNCSRFPPNRSTKRGGGENHPTKTEASRLMISLGYLTHTRTRAHEHFSVQGFPPRKQMPLVRQLFSAPWHDMQNHGASPTCRTRATGAGPSLPQNPDSNLCPRHGFCGWLICFRDFCWPAWSDGRNQDAAELPGHFTSVAICFSGPSMGAGRYVLWGLRLKLEFALASETQEKRQIPKNNFGDEDGVLPIPLLAIEALYGKPGCQEVTFVHFIHNLE